MIARFVLGGCSNVKDKEKRISIHASPFYDNPRPKTRKYGWAQWIKLWQCAFFKGWFSCSLVQPRGLKQRIWQRLIKGDVVLCPCHDLGM